MCPRLEILPSLLIVDREKSPTDAKSYVNESEEEETNNHFVEREQVDVEKQKVDNVCHVLLTLVKNVLKCCFIVFRTRIEPSHCTVFLNFAKNIVELSFCHVYSTPESRHVILALSLSIGF